MSCHAKIFGKLCASGVQRKGQTAVKAGALARTAAAMSNEIRQFSRDVTLDNTLSLGINIYDVRLVGAQGSLLYAVSYLNSPRLAIAFID